MKSESLKAARERVAEEIYDRACDRYEAHQGQAAIAEFAVELRELQRQAMVALAEYMRGYAGGTDTAIDALLDGTAPEGE